MKTSVLFLALFFAFVANVSGQDRCFTDEEAGKVIESIKSLSPAAENKKVRKELLDMREERENLNAKITKNAGKTQELIPEAKKMGERHLLRVCQLIRENGWLTKETLKDKGLEAFSFLITNNLAFKLQREMLPVLIEAANTGYIAKSVVASQVDSIRIGLGLPQIFGTEAVLKNNVIYIYPILNEEKVDEWRKAYGLPPLATQIRTLEFSYFLPVLKMPRLPVAPSLSEKKDDKSGDTSILGISNDETETLSIETKLVNLNVRVLTQDFKPPPPDLKFLKQHFSISEDGVEQEIVFFSASDQPFDLVLLLDFSGSTIEKRGLIKKAAQRFVEYARPTDRIAVVAFATEIKIISELTMDKSAISQKIKDIELNGMSPIWDSFKFTYENIIKKESAGRRSAIVFMTDGEDSSEKSTFADAMEIVRRGETTVFPVYLDTGTPFNEWVARNMKKAQQSLSMLAEESGGQYYKADSAKDLNGIYEQVINDIGKIYSLGYEPKNEARDGGWRNLTVKIKAPLNLITRVRRGYYAR